MKKCISFISKSPLRLNSSILFKSHNPKFLILEPTVRPCKTKLKLIIYNAQLNKSNIPILRVRNGGHSKKEPKKPGRVSINSDNSGSLSGIIWASPGLVALSLHFCCLQHTSWLFLMAEVFLRKHSTARPLQHPHWSSPVQLHAIAPAPPSLTSVAFWTFHVSLHDIVILEFYISASSV